MLRLRLERLLEFEGLGMQRHSDLFDRISFSWAGTDKNCRYPPKTHIPLSTRPFLNGFSLKNVFYKTQRTTPHGLCRPAEAVHFFLFYRACNKFCPPPTGCLAALETFFPPMGRTYCVNCF